MVIATADNKLAAIGHYVERGNVEALDAFLKTGRTHWLTADDREKFELTTFTPHTLTKLFESAGFEVLDVIGKTILPVRQNKRLLETPGAVDRLIAMEYALAGAARAAAAAGHLQVTARRRV